MGFLPPALAEVVIGGGLKLGVLVELRPVASILPHECADIRAERIIRQSPPCVNRVIR